MRVNSRPYRWSAGIRVGLALALAAALLQPTAAAHAQGGAVSSPAVVAGPSLNSPVVADTFSNIYGYGEAIVVSFTFSEPVTVTGEPRVALSIGAFTVWAGYSGSGDDGATLSFTHTVAADDWDTDGVSIAADALELNGGAIAGAGGVAADLSHPAATPGSTHQVDGIITTKQPLDPPADDPDRPPRPGPPRPKTTGPIRSQIEAATPTVSVGPILNSPRRRPGRSARRSRRRRPRSASARSSTAPAAAAPTARASRSRSA